MNKSATKDSLLSFNENQEIPTYPAFLSRLSNDVRSQHRTAFLPIIPFPITEYDVVYTAMERFLEILQQLDQKYLPIACDEGVYRLGRHIKMIHETEFQKIFFVLGGFHMAKVAYGCAGKFLSGSSIDNAFIEKSIFGINITQQALSGSHYNRSVAAYSLLSEALFRMQLNAFFIESSKAYDNELVIINMLKDCIIENNWDEAKIARNLFNSNASELKNDFQNFVNRRSCESPLFKYFNLVIILIDLARNLIKADRTGDFLLHIETVKKLQPIFHMMNRTNYAR